MIPSYPARCWIVVLSLERALVGCFSGHQLVNGSAGCSAFATSLRREVLSWSYHELIASYPADQQKKWLDRLSLRIFPNTSHLARIWSRIRF